MATLAVPVKTQLGLDELRGRARTLGQRHRTVLLLVDGRRALSEVLSLAQQAGAQTSHFEDLVRMGMVQLPREALAADSRDTAPSAFDTLRVTSVELDVPAGVRPSGFGREAAAPQEAPAWQEPPPFSVSGDVPLSVPTPLLTEAPRSNPQVSTVQRRQAVPAVLPPTPAGTGPDSVAMPDADLPLRARQVPLVSGLQNHAQPSFRTLSAGDETDSPNRVAATPSPAPQLKPARAVPAAAAELKPAPPPAARRTAVPTASAPSIAAKPTRAAMVPPAARKLLPQGMQPSGPAERLPPPPTLSPGDAAAGATAPSPQPRRGVLDRLASPRAGSLRVPDEPAAKKLDRVRELLVETLRLDAPIFGVRMLIRLRAAVSANDLIELVWDIERHLISARHSREEMLNLHRARELLGLGNTVVADDDGEAE